LTHLDCLDEQVAQCDSEIHRHMAQSAPAAVSAEPSPTAPRAEPPAELTPVQAPLPSAPGEEAERAPTTSVPLSFAEALTLLDTIPGVNQRLAEIFLAEIGTDMSRFPDAAHLASWVGICPGNHQSEGLHLSGTTRKGDRWLRQALIEAAHGAMRTKETY
jgi:transposase